MEIRRRYPKFGKTIRLVLMLSMTGIFFLVELIVGYLTNSMALVADSFHMLSDLVALVVGLFSVRIAKRKSEKNTFGWVRAEVVGALINSVFLCALCFSIFIESIQRFIEGVEIKDPRLVLIVGCVGLLVNIAGLFLFHEHDHGHGHSHGHDHSHRQLDHVEPLPDASSASTTIEITTQIQDEPKVKVANGSQRNLLLRSTFLHVAGDALGSVVVIVAATIIWQTNWKYRHYIDPAMSILSVILILYMTIPLLRSSALILLQTVPLHIKARDVKEKLQKMQSVLAVHELHIWQLAGNRIVASAHIWFEDYEAYKRTANAIKEFFHNEGIHSTTIQPEFEDFRDGLRSPNFDPSFCMLVCPEKRCSENMCCQPERIPKSQSRDASLDEMENFGQIQHPFQHEDNTVQLKYLHHLYSEDDLSYENAGFRMSFHEQTIASSTHHQNDQHAVDSDAHTEKH